MRENSRSAARLPAERRQRPPRAAGQFPGHELRAALLARRHQGRHEHRGERPDQHLRDGRAWPRSSRRLTNSPAIDTSPCFSTDGSQIVFNSDRGGAQQLYIMSAGGGGERRVSFGEGRYATPVWSPRGDFIAFTKIAAGRFRHRRHAIGRQRRAHAGQRLPCRGADLGAQRARVDVLPPATQLGRPGGLGYAAPGRHHRPLRTAGADARRMHRIRPGRP